jgi:hypothetical protein
LDEAREDSARARGGTWDGRSPRRDFLGPAPAAALQLSVGNVPDGKFWSFVYAGGDQFSINQPTKVPRTSATKSSRTELTAGAGRSPINQSMDRANNESPNALENRGELESRRAEGSTGRLQPERRLRRPARTARNHFFICLWTSVCPQLSRSHRPPLLLLHPLPSAEEPPAKNIHRSEHASIRRLPAHQVRAPLPPRLWAIRGIAVGGCRGFLSLRASFVGVLLRRIRVCLRGHLLYFWMSRVH